MSKGTSLFIKYIFEFFVITIFLLAIKKPTYFLYLGDHTTEVTLPSSLPLLSTDKLLKKWVVVGKMSKSNLTRYIDLLKPLSLCLSKADFPTKSKSTSKLSYKTFLIHSLEENFC